jgi:hypothetical protein
LSNQLLFYIYFQPDLQEIAKVCLERMNLLTQKKLEHKNEKTLSSVKNVEK